MSQETITCVGCGHPIPVPADHENWSTVTQANKPYKVLLLDCPECSTAAVRDDTVNDIGLASLGYASNQRMNLVVEPA